MSSGPRPSPARPSPGRSSPDGRGRQAVGGRAYRQGHGAEWMAAAWLMAKGYQILAFRLKTRGGEIDILARRGRTLAVVEVKRRLNQDDALLAVKPAQHARLLRAGHAVLKSKPSLQGLDLRLDLIALAPGRWPRHLRGLVYAREPHDA